MKSVNSGVNISILGKEFMVACPENERAALTEAARLLDGKMREIHDSGKVIGTERCAVMAALNIANELLQVRKQQSALPPDMDQKLRFLQGKIDAALQGEVRRAL
jgi:cell division protein ZapA